MKSYYQSMLIMLASSAMQSTAMHVPLDLLHPLGLEHKGFMNTHVTLQVKTDDLRFNQLIYSPSVL